MANWSTLKAAIASIIKTNGNQAITGQLLQNVLNNILSSVGENSTFAGIATPTTNPGMPDGPVFYFATAAGVYANFNGIEVSEGEAAILLWNNGTWSKKNSGLATEQEIIYDVSARNGGIIFESLQALLSSPNLSTLIPTSVRNGGMSIRFIQGSDNNYVQFRLMKNTWSTTVSDWQGVDNEPTEGSNNFVKSGGVVKAINKVYSDENLLLSTLTTHSDINRKATSALSATAGSVYDLTPVSENYYRFYKIPVFEGGIYKIGVQAASSPAKAWAFLDENMTVLDISDAVSGDDTKVLQPVTITAPIGSKWLIVHAFRKDNTIMDNYTDFVYLVGKVNLNLNGIEKDVNELKYFDVTNWESTLNNRILKSDGTTDNARGVTIKCISVLEGDEFLLRYCFALYQRNKTYVAYCVYNSETISSETLVYAGQRLGGYFEGKIKIPAGGTMLAVSVYNADDAFFLKKYINMNNELAAVKTNVSEIQNEVSKVENNVGIYTEEVLPIGEKDNFFKYCINHVIRKDYISNKSSGFGGYNKTENGYTELHLALYDNSYVDAVLCVKKQNNYIHITHQTGLKISYNLNSLTKNQLLYERQGNGGLGGRNIGKVLYVDDNWVQIYLYGSSSYSDVKTHNYTIKVLDTIRESSQSQVVPFELWEDYCGTYFSEGVLDKDIKPMCYYKSRAEKLGSNLLGKSAIAYGDSLSHFMDYLVFDWGLSIYSFSEGGSRIGYVLSPGQSSNGHWLCRDAVVQRFIADKPEHIDFIINMDGNNEDYRTYGMPNASDIEFVYNNKRWYDKENLESDPFDSLTDNEKMRFLGSTCYIVSAYSLAQLFPNVQLVVVEPYFNTAYSQNFEDGKWVSISGFATDLLAEQVNINGKKEFLRQLAEKMSAIYIPDYVDVGFLNAPTHIIDGTHPDNVGSRSKAWSIAKAINFPADIDNAIY